MEKKETILNYIEETYQPDAVIVYGSFANGTAGPGSDFDALVIADHGKTHDSSVIDGTVLDVFVYPPEQFRSDYDPLPRLRPAPTFSQGPAPLRSVRRSSRM